MVHSIRLKSGTRKVSPPNPSFMNDDQLGEYRQTSHGSNRRIESSLAEGRMLVQWSIIILFQSLSVKGVLLCDGTD